MSSSPTEPDNLTEAFLMLLTEHEKRLGIYVTGLISCPQDAQDILQEGKIVMWRNFKSFELGTNFPAWGRKILFHQILAYRRKSKNRQSEMLNEDTLILLNESAESAIRENRWAKRESALNSCLKKMKEEHRSIVQMRYRDEASIEKIARRASRTEGAIYRLLSRLRQNLYECVEQETEQA